jgi:predicted RNA-binding protein YlqC (UPF0109 family)
MAVIIGPSTDHRVELLNQVLLNLKVAPADKVKTIGKQGRTARSLRMIVSAFAMKSRWRYSLNIEEDLSSGQRE